MKWYHWAGVGLCVVGYYFFKYIIFGNNKPDGKFLKWLDKKSIHHKEKIKFIDDRMNRRKLAYEINKEKKLDMEKTIKRMSGSELNKFIERNL
jgi:hypothetical protein